MKIQKKQNAQFSLEFIVLIAFMFLIFLSAITIITSKVLEAKEKEREETAGEIAALVREEIDIAISVSEGYVRTFKVPNKVRGHSYTIEIIDDRELVVIYLGKEHVMFLPENVIGEINLGVNEIKKIDGVVYLRHITECKDGIDNDGDGFCDLAASTCTDGSTPGDTGCLSESDNDETDCGDGECEGFETCWKCEDDCGPCPLPARLIMRSSSNAISFDSDGNVILEGSLTEDTIPTPSDTEDEFILKNSGGESVAIINLVTGDMVVKGYKYEGEPTWEEPEPSSNDFIVKDDEGNVVSYIDDSGNFYLKGTLTSG